MINHTIKRILNRKQYYIYNLIFIMITFLIVLILLTMSDISKAKVESEINFHEEAILLSEGISSNNYINGYYFDETTFDKINNYNTYTFQQHTEVSASVPQNLEFHAVTSNFIETGVSVNSYKKNKTLVQKLELIHGTIWNSTNYENQVIVDLDTANLVFGTSNVVNRKLNTNLGEMNIIGVVSNTITRNEFINHLTSIGGVYQERDVPSYVYMPYEFYKEFSDEGYNRRIIFKQNNKDININKENILELLGLNKDDISMLLTKEDLVNQELISKEVLFDIILVLVSVLGLLSIINIINVSSFLHLTEKKTIGVYKVYGATTFDLVIISLLEAILLGIFTSIVSSLISFIVIVVISLTNNTLKFIDLVSFIKNAGLISLIVLVLLMIINLTIALLNHTKKIQYYLKES